MYFQYGEDDLIAPLLPQTGYYVDVGAGDPIRLSNTYALDVAGWQGLCVEADHRRIPQLREHRTATIVHCAIGRINGVINLQLARNPDLSTTTGRNLRRWERCGIDQVTQKTLDTVLHEVGVSRIDLLSIDVEGTEQDVWTGFSWQQYKPGIVIIEYNLLGRKTDLTPLFAGTPYLLIHKTRTNLIYKWRDVPT